MPSPTARPCIVWFRDDLRLSDHPALHAVSKTGAPVVCLYVLDEQSRALKPPEARPIGGAASRRATCSRRSMRFRGRVTPRRCVRGSAAGPAIRSSTPACANSGAPAPDNLIHQPWIATPLELASAGVELGNSYPEPIVNHKVGRERALAAYAKIRNAN